MSKEQQFHFPQGIPGFEDYADFQLMIDEESPLAQLVSVENSHIGFVLARPEIFFPSYLESLSEELCREKKPVLWDIESEESISVWVIIAVDRKDASKSTANLRAPLLLNQTKQEGIQFIADTEVFSSRQPLFQTTLNDEEREGGATDAGSDKED